MNRKPDSTLRFAVNRADMLSRLPGVQLSAHSKRFARGKPKLVPTEPTPFGASYHDSVFPLQTVPRRTR